MYSAVYDHQRAEGGGSGVGSAAVGRHSTKNVTSFLLVRKWLKVLVDRSLGVSRALNHKSVDDLKVAEELAESWLSF
jgi:hypothetical protein